MLDAAGIFVSAVSADVMTFFNPLLRPLLFVAMSSRTRRALATFGRVLPSLADWSGLLILLVVFYALLGVLLFGPPDALLGDDGAYFRTVPRALMSLVVLITTANFPDVMLAAYSQSRATFLFFCTFLLIGVFFLMNMFLAEIVVNYKRQLDADKLHRRTLRDNALKFAFELLDFDRSGTVDLQIFIRLIRRVERPIFSFHDEFGTGRFNTATASRNLQALLSTDEDLRTSGLGVEPFVRLVLTLQHADSGDSSRAEGRRPSMRGDQLVRALSGRLSLVGTTSCSDGMAHRRPSQRDQQLRSRLLEKPHLPDDEGSPPGETTSGQRTLAVPRSGAVGGAYSGSGTDELSPNLPSSSLSLPGRADTSQTGAGDDGIRTNTCQSQSFHRPNESAVQDSVTRACLRRLTRWMATHGTMERGVTLVLLGDAALLVAEVVLASRAQPEPLQQLLVRSAPAFDLVYVMEIASRLWSQSWRAYVTYPAFAFDALVTSITVSADVVAFAMAASQPHPHVLRIALSLRTLRMLRLVTSIRSFRLIFRRFANLLPNLSGLFGALLALFSVYAQIGVLWFGGSLYDGDSYERASGSETLYLYCNFNDFGSAFM